MGPLSVGSSAISNKTSETVDALKNPIKGLSALRQKINVFLHT